MTGHHRSPTLAIADNVDVPLLGLGTWQTSGDETYTAVRAALDIGYRHIDTATMYGNERAVGRAVRESGLDRSEVFVTTKLPPNHAGREQETIDDSLHLLGLDFVDLWLVHWPPAGQATPRTWERFIEVRDAGQARAIGVSNYSVAQIDELITATGVTPAVNQIQWGPGVYDRDIQLAHRDRGIALEGWSPFLSTNMNADVLAEIADAHRVTPHQVVLRWHLQHETVAIPKSGDPARIAANFDIFDFTLTTDEMATIDARSYDLSNR